MITLIATAIGAVTAITFAGWWFNDVKGHCGVVRFYEQLLGAIVIGGWLGGTGIGVLVAVIGCLRRSGAVIVGAIVTTLVNVGLVFLCARIAFG